MSFARVLVPLDGSQVAENALDHARRMVTASGGELYLLYVLSSLNHNGDSHIDPLDWQLQQARAQRYLDRHGERLSAIGLTVSKHIDEGDPAAQILEFAKRHAIDLIVFSAYGRGDASRFRFGGTVQKAVRGTQTSILIVRPGPAGATASEQGYRRVLVPLDGSYRAEWAACEVVSLLRSAETELILLQIIVTPNELPSMRLSGDMAALKERLVAEQLRMGQHYLETVCRRMQSCVKVGTRLVRARSAAKEIVRTAERENVDLVALSAHGGSDESIWELGSVADAVASHCDRPVLIFQDLPTTQPCASADDHAHRDLTGLYRPA